jgi:coenzyme F420-reducing hydrogenase beta subunit
MKKTACCGCAACAGICPTGAVRMVPDGEGFRYPTVDEARCVRCGRCEAVCPLRPLRGANKERVCLGARAREDDVRLGSSSGGVFPVLAEYVLRRRGVVFGAAFSDSMEVVHREAWNAEELEALRRTKYVQSRTDGVYRRVEELLREGVWVLFCGTPCQAHGLKRFLGREYPRLLLVDLVCYGVPSPGIWRDYTAFLERRRGSLTAFSFRDKRDRDHGRTRAYTAGGREYAAGLSRDLMYFANLTIRPSCHACAFAGPDRESDFTLGDFWGVERVRPEVDDGMGISLVFLHTERARKKVWSEVQDAFDWFPCGEEAALQPRLRGPAPPSRLRGVFMGLYRVLPPFVFFLLFEKMRAAAELPRRLVRYFR